MNLESLLELQREWDTDIVRERGLEGVNLLPRKILALQVALGELANEWQGFKFWKVDPQPNTRELMRPAMNEEDKLYRNPLLEDYVNCLGFILSIGLELDVSDSNRTLSSTPAKKEITERFTSLLFATGTLDYGEQRYSTFLGEFIKLGEQLGFTWEKVAQAYLVYANQRSPVTNE